MHARLRNRSLLSINLDDIKTKKLAVKNNIFYHLSGYSIHPQLSFAIFPYKYAIRPAASGLLSLTKSFYSAP